MVDAPGSTLIHSVLTQPRRWLVFGVLLVAAGMSGLPWLELSTDYRAFFSADNPELQAFEAFEHEYELTETVIFAVDGHGASLFTPQRLAALRSLTQDGWRMPYATRSQSLTNYQHTYAEGDDIIVQPLIPDGTITPEAAARAQRIALDTEALVDRMISADGTVAGVFVSTRMPHTNPTTEVPEVTDAARALAERIERAHPDLTVHITGVTLLNDTLAQVMHRDILVLTPASLLLVSLGLLIFFRRIALAVVTVGVIGGSVLGALGVAAHAGIVLTDASAASMLCIMTLAVADCVHILTTYAQAGARGMDKRAALTEALRINAEPVFVTSLTTAIGFLALNASESPPFRDLGNIVAIGVGFALVLSITALPAALMLMPGDAPRRAPSGVQSVERLGRWVVRHRRLSLLGSAAVLAVLIAGLERNRFGDNYIDYFPQDNAFRQATEFVNRELSGMQVLEYSIPAAAADGITDPVYLQHLDELADWFEQQPITRKVITLPDLLRRLNMTMHGDDPAFDRIPESRELAAQYLLFYELSLPAGLSLNNLIATDRDATRFTVLFDAVDSGRVRAIEQRAQAWMAENLPAYMQAPGTGTTMMFARISQRNFEAMVVGVAAAVLLIAGVLAWVFRSPALGAASMIPNLLPGLAAYGTWGYLVGRLDLSLSVVGSLSLGIIVDDTVHFLSKYRRARRELGFDAPAAVQHAFAVVGPALVATSAILVAGFALFTASHFSMVVNLGQLTAIAIALALFCDFLFLPPLLMWLDRRR